MSITLISTVTVGAGGAATIGASSIPASYTDLLVVVSAQTTAATSAYMTFNINGVTTNFSGRWLYGTGTGAGSDASIPTYATDVPNTTQTANTFSNASFYFPNYAGATNKSISVDAVYENNASNATQTIQASLWSNTAAINAVSFALNTGNFAQYSSLSVYGVTKGSSGGVTVA